MTTGRHLLTSQSRLTSRSLAVVLGIALCALALPRPARAGAPGTLVILTKPVSTDPSDFDKRVKAEATTKLKKSGDNWHVYFVAYMKKPPGAAEINVVFYDAAKKNSEPIAYQVQTQPTAKIVMADFEAKGEDGLKSGNKYNVRVTRLINGHEETYASTTLELAD